jgi:hypothetical protein
MTEPKLPPLPSPGEHTGKFAYVEHDMIAYALQAIAATAPLLEQIAALTAQLEEAKQDAADADSMSKALADLDTKNHRRWTFLHTNNKDAQGFEWCVMRVKWENGRISEALHTNSDMTDLDAAIAAQEQP